MKYVFEGYFGGPFSTVGFFVGVIDGRVGTGDGADRDAAYRRPVRVFDGAAAGLGRRGLSGRGRGRRAGGQRDGHVLLAPLLFDPRLQHLRPRWMPTRSPLLHVQRLHSLDQERLHVVFLPQVVDFFKPFLMLYNLISLLFIFFQFFFT